MAGIILPDITPRITGKPTRSPAKQFQFRRGGDAAYPLVMIIGDSQAGGVATHSTVRTVNRANIWNHDNTEFDTPLIADNTGTTSNNQADPSQSGQAIGLNVRMAELLVSRYGGCNIVMNWHPGASSTPQSTYAAGWEHAGGQYVAELLEKYDAAKADLDARGESYFNYGIYISLGIVDASTELDAWFTGWQMMGLVNRIRDHVGDHKLPVVVAIPYANGEVGYDYVSTVSQVLNEGGALLSYVDTMDISGFSFPGAGIHYDETGYNDAAEAAYALFEAQLNTVGRERRNAAAFDIYQLPGLGAFIEADSYLKTANADSAILTVHDRTPYHMDIQATATTAHHPALKMDGSGRPYFDMVDSGTAATSSLMILAPDHTAMNDYNAMDYVVGGTDKQFWMLAVLEGSNTGQGIVCGQNTSANGKSFAFSMVDGKPAAIFYFNAAGSIYRGSIAASALSAGTHVVLLQFNGTVDTKNNGENDTTADALKTSDKIILYADDPDTPLALEVWANGGTYAGTDVNTDTTSYVGIGQNSADGAAGDGNALDGIFHAFCCGTGLLTDAQRANLMNYFKNKWVDNAPSFDWRSLPNLAIILEPSNTDRITKDGSNIVSAIANPGTGNDWAASGTAKPKYVASVSQLNNKPALQHFHDETNMSYISVSDSAALDYSKFEIFGAFYRVIDTGLVETLFGKGTTTGNQREFAMQVETNEVQRSFVSTAGTAASSGDTDGTSDLNEPVAFIVQGRFDGTNVDTIINNDTAKQARRAAVPFAGTGPFFMGSQDGALYLKGYTGDIAFVTCKLDDSVIDFILQDMATRYNITLVP